MRILDRYLVKQFLQTTFFALVSFLMIFVIIDVMEKLGRFIDKDVPGNIILQYYAVFLPEIVRLMIPVAVLLSSLFVAGKMSNQNELTAMRSSGVSSMRFMAPFLITSLLISFGAVYFGGYIVPLANKHKVYIEREYLRKHRIGPENNIFFQDSKTRIVSIGYYNVNTNRASSISIQNFDENDITRMTSRIDAIKMTYDTTKSVWTLGSGIERKFDGIYEHTNKFSSLEYPDLNFTPEEVLKKQRRSEEMTLSELSEFSEEQLRSGNDPTRIEIEYHSRWAFAFASIITVLLGLPISANKRGGGLAIQFGISLLITFVYLVFMKISQAFGKNGVMNPFFTAWFANFFFLAIAIVNIFKSRK